MHTRPVRLLEKWASSWIIFVKESIVHGKCKFEELVRFCTESLHEKMITNHFIILQYYLAEDHMVKYQLSHGHLLISPLDDAGHLKRILLVICPFLCHFYKEALS
jgi:hypothetical protein